MPSPFPGMDPYLEAPSSWRGVHHALMTYIRDAIQPQLGPDFAALIEERVYVLSASRPVYPDVAVVRQIFREPIAEYEIATRHTPAQVSNGPGVAEPIVVELTAEEFAVPFIEILNTKAGEVVTVIEVISPFNKADGDGREQYLKKQAEVLRSSANLVEIDLHGEGKRLIPKEPRDELGRVPMFRYLVSVSRAANRDRLELYPIPLEGRLPRFRVPLLRGDADAVLDLQEVFDRCYDNGRYDRLIDYTQPPPVLLSREERGFVRQTLGAFASWA